MFRYMVVIMLIISVTSSVFAADKIPRQEFIKLADSCIDALDEFTILFANDNVDIGEAEALQQKYKLRVTRFDRYYSKNNTDIGTLQDEIVSKNSILQFNLRTQILRLKLASFGRENIIDLNPIRQEIEKGHEEISTRLLKYKNGGSAKKKSAGKGKS